MVVVWSLSELNGSSPIIWKVRFQTSSGSNFVRGVEYFRRDDLLGRAGIVSSLGRRCDELRFRVCRSVAAGGCCRGVFCDYEGLFRELFGA